MKMNKLFAALLCITLLLAAAAMAAPAIDTARAVQLTVALRDDGAALPGAQLSIHRIASVGADGKLKVLAPFDKYNVKLDTGSESAMDGIADTLGAYVLRDQLAPAASCTSNDGGNAVFPDLQQGLYLVMGQRYVHNGRVYTIQPSLVQLPLWNAAGEAWIYDVVTNAKHESRPDEPQPAPINRKVLKVWNDNGHTASRPREVVVQLLRDGEVYDTVTLSMRNLWRHSWTGLDANHSWNLVEKETEGYSVAVRQEGITFVVTNTYDSENPPSAPTPTPTPKPDSPGLGDADRPSRLPQTGQPWWPAAMLAFVGLLLVVIGLARRRGH